MTFSKRQGGARTPSVRAPLACLTLALMAFAAAGCGSKAANNVHASSPARDAASTATHHFGTELWRFYRQSGREPGVVNVIDLAEQTVEARCMRRAGFLYRPVPTEPVGGVLLDGLSPVPSGDPPSEATMLRVERSHGFGIYARFRAEQSTAPQANSNYVAALTPAGQRRYFLALYGDRLSTVSVKFPDGSVDTGPGGGCLGASAKTVYGSVVRDDFRLNAVVDVKQLIEQEVDARTAMKTATELWSRCMERSTGRRFASQTDLVEWLTALYGVGPAISSARRLEIRYSTLSTICMYQTGAEARYAAETWNVMSRMPDVWYRTLVEVRDWDTRALKTAKAILRQSALSL